MHASCTHLPCRRTLALAVVGRQPSPPSAFAPTERGAHRQQVDGQRSSGSTTSLHLHCGPSSCWLSPCRLLHLPTLSVVHSSFLVLILTTVIFCFCSSIDIGPIQCYHGKVSASKVTSMKRASAVGWQKLFSKVWV
jgi:hypothetical protein